jgi:hypothetical protein
MGRAGRGRRALVRAQAPCRRGCGPWRSRSRSRAAGRQPPPPGPTTAPPPPPPPPLQASVSIRKGNKKLAVFDLKLELEWQCSAADSDKQVRRAPGPGALEHRAPAAARCSPAGNARGRTAQPPQPPLLPVRRRALRARPSQPTGQPRSRPASQSGARPPRAQVTGKIEVSEFASAHDEDDYLFSCTVDGGGQQVGRAAGGWRWAAQAPGWAGRRAAGLGQLAGMAQGARAGRAAALALPGGGCICTSRSFAATHSCGSARCPASAAGRQEAGGGAKAGHLPAAAAVCTGAGAAVTERLRRLRRPRRGPGPAGPAAARVISGGEQRSGEGSAQHRWRCGLRGQQTERLQSRLFRAARGTGSASNAPIDAPPDAPL